MKMEQTNTFIAALNPHYNDAVTYCRSLCSKWSPEEAEDVLQQALLKAFENYSQLREQEKFRSWLFTIITRTFYSMTRKHFWKNVVPMDKVPEFEKFPEVYDRNPMSDTKRLIHQALSKLSSKERAAILLFEVGGFSVDEIMNIQKEKTASSVKSRLSRARKKMREFLVKQEKATMDRLSRKQLIRVGDIERETLNLISNLEIRGTVD